MTAKIEGQVEPGFEGVRDAFAANFDQHGEVGAAFSLYVEGRKMVDVWGGTADADTGRPYDQDSLQLVFSTTKGATAVCANLLAQRGELDIDEPVTTYWPEFASGPAAEAKAKIPVRWLLCHKAGLPVIDATMSLEEAMAWDPVIRALEQQEPVWEPGTAHGYHATTYGWLVGEVVRRISGKSLGTFFADEVAKPLGLEFWIGLPDSEHGRVAPLITGGSFERPSDPEAAKMYDQFMGPESLTGRALSSPGGALANDAFNNPTLWRGEVPAANGITNARSLARMYAGLVGEVDGVRILGADQVKLARERQTEGTDRVLYMETAFGLGFMLSSPFSPFGGPSAFGHPGAGGSVGFADPDANIGFGYVMNKMQQNLSGDQRTIGLIDAVYAAL